MAAAAAADVATEAAAVVVMNAVAVGATQTRCAHLSHMSSFVAKAPREYTCSFCGNTAPGIFFRCSAPACAFAECETCAAASMRNNARVGSAYVWAVERRHRDVMHVRAALFAVVLVIAGGTLFAAGNHATGGALMGAMGIVCTCVAASASGCVQCVACFSSAAGAARGFRGGGGIGYIGG